MNMENNLPGADGDFPDGSEWTWSLGQEGGGVGRRANESKDSVTKTGDTLCH